jgi:hypothetical protein
MLKIFSNPFLFLASITFSLPYWPSVHKEPTDSVVVVFWVGVS